MEVSQGGVPGNVGKLPRQGSTVVEARQKIRSWSESHEDEWRRVSTKPEDKIQVHTERNSRGLHRPILIDGGKGNIGRKCFVVKGIEHQGEKKVNI